MARARRLAGRAVRAVRNAWDRALHPRRHRDAREQVAAAQPQSILVVCYGNICRSPYLAAVLSASLPRVVVRSAGFVGAGRPAPDHSLTIASRRGLDLSAHRSQLVTHELVADADLVVVMDARQARILRDGFGVAGRRIVVAGDLDPQGGTARAIEDPWNRALDVFEASFARLDRCARSLVTLITR